MDATFQQYSRLIFHEWQIECGGRHEEIKILYVKQNLVLFITSWEPILTGKNKRTLSITIFKLVAFVVECLTSVKRVKQVNIVLLN